MTTFSIMMIVLGAVVCIGMICRTIVYTAELRRDIALFKPSTTKRKRQ